MANSYSSNVARFTSSATLVGNFKIAAIKYVGATSGSAGIYETSSSGSQVWEQAGSSNFEDQGLNIICNAGFNVQITNSAVVYVYLK